MLSRKVTSIFFSPGGTTKQIAGQISSAISNSVESIDLLNSVPALERVFSSDDLLVVSMPVFSGRIPTVCADMLHKIQGNSTPAIAVTVYGNRAYEDALLELSTILNTNGFCVIGGCTAVARHSIFPKVAQNRPDGFDEKQFAAFASAVTHKLVEGNLKPPSIPGNSPYREAGSLPLNPTGSRKCTHCGICVQTCPVKAIPENAPRQTQANLCINCTACIYACPQKARSYKGLKYRLAAKAFGKKCSQRKEPSFFI